MIRLQTSTENRKVSDSTSVLSTQIQCSVHGITSKVVDVSPLSALSSSRLLSQQHSVIAVVIGSQPDQQGLLIPSDDISHLPATHLTAEP